ncbi:unnamed protein product [Brassica oleracea]
MHKPCHNGLPIPTRLQLRNQTLQIFHYRTEFESQRNKVMTCRGLRIAYVYSQLHSIQFSLREIRISQHDELQATTAISELRSTFFVLIHLQAMPKLNPQICLRKKPAPTHNEAKSGTALSTLLSFFHTEIAYDSFTARRESLVGATMVNF